MSASGIKPGCIVLQHVIDAGSINSFKNRLQKLRQTKPLHGLDGPPGPKASLVPGSLGTGAAAPGKLPGKW